MTDEAEQGGLIGLALPGLELVDDQYGRPNSGLRLAVQSTLEALAKDGLLLPRHTALAQLALELADAVTAGRRLGRASAVAMAAGQLRDTLLALPAPSEAGEAEQFAAFVELLANGRKPEAA